MYFGGFQKNSLIDFPGKIAAVAFTPGCNFTCPYCHNPDLANAPVSGGETLEGSLVFREEILTFLDKRKGMIQGLAITGGEPTLQKDLIDFIGQVRQMGYQIKLDSNGTRPGVLELLFEKGWVDYLAMDIKTDLAHYPQVMKHKKETRAIAQSIALIMAKAPAYEFRTTCVRPLISPSIMEEIGKMIQGADLYVLQKCSRNVAILDPQFLADEGHFFDDREMTELGAVISPYVTSVKIR